jgi:hypothetical protein
MRKIVLLAVVVMSLCVSSEVLSAGQPGTADTVFNRRFMQKLKPMMPYEQLVKIVGTEGVKAGEDKRVSPLTVAYHWNGERKSALDAVVSAGKVVTVTVTSPKNKKFTFEKNGD